MRRAEDISSLRLLIPAGMLVVAKIEKDTALAAIGSIVEASDAVMVARGDLGVELPFEEVPIAQKRIIAVCNALGRPVITATQMLESMMHESASDARRGERRGERDSRWHRCGDALGRDGRGRVSAARGERDDAHHHGDRAPPAPARDVRGAGGCRRPRRDGGCDRRGDQGRRAARSARRSSIVITKSGFSARIIASHRPGVPILVLTDSERTYRQLALVWGVVPELVPRATTYEEMFEHARIGDRAPRAREARRPRARHRRRAVRRAWHHQSAPGRGGVKLTFLGTGTSFGVPQIGCDCEVCRSADPRDKRTRSGALVETDAGKRILIDTPPELRLQLIAAHVGQVDAILFTHEHADHIHGIDDVRALSGAEHARRSTCTDRPRRSYAGAALRVHLR